MLVLPEDLGQYLDPRSRSPIDPGSTRIADAVRMSMSIPFFFTPDHPRPRHQRTGLYPSSTAAWCPIFPVWIFDVDGDAQRPTFGFRLVGGEGAGGGYARVFEHIGWVVKTAVDLFQTASDAFDTESASHSTAVRTCALDADGIGTTDFTLTAKQKQTLVDLGREGAQRFLSGFDASAYVNSYGHGLVGPALGPVQLLSPASR